MTPSHTAKARHYTVVGGGASGTLFAIAAADHARRHAGNRNSASPLTLTVFEPREQLGQGLAYSSVRAEHLLNVPAGRLSALPDQPEDLLDWCHAQGIDAQPSSFIERRAFGAYLSARFAERSAPTTAVNVEHVRARVVDVIDRPNGYVVRAGDGGESETDGVVLATGYGLTPGNALFTSVESPLVVRDPYAADAFAALERAGVVVVVGTGLTAVDVILTLAMERPNQPVIAVSRRGLLPSVHDLEVDPVVLRTVARTARGLVREVRGAARDVESAGGDWRAVIDALRSQLPELWRELPPAERSRFLRLARRHWEVHRHRLAPQPATTLERLMRSGQVEIRKAAPVEISVSADWVDVSIRHASSAVERVRARGVVLCTSTIDDDWIAASPLLGRLVARGLICADPLGIGPAVDGDGRFVNARGEPQPRLWAIGPLRRAAEWEATAISEIRRQASEIVGQL